jgi:hypothetical protein
MKNYFFFLIFICYLFAAKPVFAQKTFSDDFYTNLNKWILVNGAMNYWQVSGGALYATVLQSYSLSTIVPKDEFWQGMSEYTVDFIFKSFDGTDKNFVVGMRDFSNFYDFHFYSNQLIVEDIRMGFSLHSMTVPFILEINKNYSIHLLYSKEKIELFIDGVKIFVTDYLWSPPIYGGKFGLKIATGPVQQSSAYFDQVEVKEFKPRDTLFKQNDPLWGMKTYDHANLWSSNPSMSNWACAVSSAAMLMRAYGYQFLPTGEEINPDSLNLWLSNQNDGYIANGLLNWLAISRLSKILSDNSANLLPKLEFSYFKGSKAENLTLLRENLIDDRVQIAATTAHFFLVDDYLETSNDFSIKDPLYEYKFLSERTEEVDSLRIFKPSFTDLSYLLFVLPQEIDFSLTDDKGKKIEQLQTITEEIFSDSEKIGEDYELTYYPKPSSSILNLLLDASNFNKELISKAKIYIYDQNGQFQLINLVDLIDANKDLNKIDQLLLKINYLKETESTFNLEIIEKTIDEQKQTALNDLAAKSKQDFEEGKISFYLFYQLNLLTDSLRERLDYFFLLEKFLSYHQL